MPTLTAQLPLALRWEVAQPFPPPETASYKTDPRIASVEKTLAGVDELLPGFKDMHPMGAELPQECVALFSHDFVSMIFDVQFRLNSYQSWLIQEDMTEVFKNHRRWLQLLQWKCPGQTNWLDTEGNLFGLVFWRFFLVEGKAETPVAEAVKLANLLA